MGHERGTSAAPWKSVWNLQSLIRSGQAPSLRTRKYLSSCLLSQSEECNQMQMPPSYVQFSVTHSLWLATAWQVFVPWIQLNQYPHTHQHCIWPRSNVIRDNNCLFFLPESHPTSHNTTKAPITKQTRIFLNVFVPSDPPWRCLSSCTRHSTPGQQL